MCFGRCRQEWTLYVCAPGSIEHSQKLDTWLARQSGGLHVTHSDHRVLHRGERERQPRHSSHNTSIHHLVEWNHHWGTVYLTGSLPWPVPNMIYTLRYLPNFWDSVAVNYCDCYTVRINGCELPIYAPYCTFVWECIWELGHCHQLYYWLSADWKYACTCHADFSRTKHTLWQSIVVTVEPVL